MVTEGMGWDDLPMPTRGVLYVAHTRESAKELLAKWPQEAVAFCWHSPEDPLCFPTLLVCPHMHMVGGFWRRVILLDGALSAGEAGAWQNKLPLAEVVSLPLSEAVKTLAATVDAGDEAYRELYKLLRTNAFGSLTHAAKAAGLSLAQTHAGLTAFAQLGLMEYQGSPFAYTMRPPTSCQLSDSPLMAALRGIAHAETIGT